MMDAQDTRNAVHEFARHLSIASTMEYSDAFALLYRFVERLQDGEAPMQCCPACKHGPLDDELRIGRELLYDKTTYRYFVECSCGVRGPAADNREEAIAKWNRMPR